MIDSVKIIKVTGPESHPLKVKVKGLKPKKKPVVSKEAYVLRNIKKTLIDHTTRLFKIEEKLDFTLGRMSRDSEDLDTLYILKEQLYRRTNALLAISVGELLMILAIVLILWTV